MQTTKETPTVSLCQLDILEMFPSRVRDDQVMQRMHVDKLDRNTRKRRTAAVIESTMSARHWPVHDVSNCTVPACIYNSTIIFIACVIQTYQAIMSPSCCPTLPSSLLDFLLHLISPLPSTWSWLKSFQSFSLALLCTWNLIFSTLSSI